MCKAMLKAVRAMKSRAELARQMKVSSPSIIQWERGRVPAERVLQIERLTGVSRHELRPDIYPHE